MVESLHQRLLLISLAVIMAIGLLYPAVAIADEGGGASASFASSLPEWREFWFGPDQETSSGVTAIKVGVTAYTKWDAALYALGYGADEVSAISMTARHKLSTESTGGSFYDLAQKFVTGKPDDDAISVVFPTVGFNYNSLYIAWGVAKQLYGEQYCYWSIYSKDLGTSAKRAVEQILNDDGNTGGGSGGSGAVSQPKEGNISRNVLLYYSGNGNKQFGETALVIFGSDELVDSLNEGFLSDAVKWWVQYSSAGLEIYKTDGDIEFVYDDDYRWKGLKNLEDKTTNFYNRVSKAGIHTDTSAGTITVDSISSQVYPHSVSANSVYNFGSPAQYINASIDPTYNEPEPDPDPPITWPDPPKDPDPPEVPKPVDPTPPNPPDPYTPTTPTPWSPIPDIDITITGDDFQDLLDALNEHCIHLQNSIQSNISQLWSNQSELLSTEFQGTRDDMQEYMTWLGNDVILSAFSDLNGYLNDLFEWLAEQMQFNVNVEGGQYDDSSVVYWLKRIWSKLGTGDINVRPTDPVTDNDAWWEWLLQLMDNFVGFLLGFGLDKLGDVGNALQSLTGKFPFSLPWDLAALFGLLVAPPQTPAVDFPCYTVGLDGIQQVGTYHLSLESYNDAWEQVRWLERVSFCILLIKSSDFFTSLLGKVFGK